MHTSPCRWRYLDFSKNTSDKERPVWRWYLSPYVIEWIISFDFNYQCAKGCFWVDDKPSDSWGSQIFGSKLKLGLYPSRAKSAGPMWLASHYNSSVSVFAYFAFDLVRNKSSFSRRVSYGISSANSLKLSNLPLNAAFFNFNDVTNSRTSLFFLFISAISVSFIDMILSQKAFSSLISDSLSSFMKD